MNSFDPDKALTQCGGEHGLLRDLAGYLFEEADPLVEQMRLVVGQGDGAGLASAAHRLKGTLVYLAAQPALDATDRVERLGQSGDLAEAAFAIEHLHSELACLQEAIRRDLKTA